MTDDGPGEQLVGIRANGLPLASVPLTVVLIELTNCPTVPRLERSALITDDTFPLGVWTRSTAAWVVGLPGAFVTRSIPATSVAGLGGGARYAVSVSGTPTVKVAEPLPI